jgi:gluconate 5-dehydrogenase
MAVAGRSEVTGAGTGLRGDVTGCERFSLVGRTVLVAGASRGIGLAIAREVATAGAHVVLAARSIDELERQAGRLRADGLAATPVRLDVADREDVRRVVPLLPDLDGLVNVAGTNLRKRFETYTDEEQDRIIRTNLEGPLELTRLVGARMLARGMGGKVVFIGSSNQLTSLPYLALYSMTKAALGGLTRALAAEWGGQGIQVNCVAPGLILTELTATVLGDPAIAAWRDGAQAMPRWGTPEDIAPLVVYLLGAASDFVTGQTIAVDGGYTTTKIWPFRP